MQFSPFFPPSFFDTAIVACKVGQLRNGQIHFARFIFTHSDVFNQHPPEGISKSDAGAALWCIQLSHAVRETLWLLALQSARADVFFIVK